MKSQPTSPLEAKMLLHLRAYKLPAPEREHRFHPTRRWRFDMAWPDRKVALEVEGGTWAGGRHTRGKGFEEDCTKYAEAITLGWRVFRVTEKHIDSGDALRWVATALGLAWNGRGFEMVAP